MSSRGPSPSRRALLVGALVTAVVVLLWAGSGRGTRPRAASVTAAPAEPGARGAARRTELDSADLRGADPPLSAPPAPVRVEARAEPTVFAPSRDLARLEIVATASGKPVAGAALALRGLGDVVAVPGTPCDADGQPVTDRRGRVAVFVRPMSTWQGDVAASSPPLTASFVATSPRAGESREVLVELAPGHASQFVHLALVSAPSGAAVPSALVRAVYSERAADAPDVPDLAGATSAVSDVAGNVVLCWPEGTLLSIQADGHSVRYLDRRMRGASLAGVQHEDATAAALAVPTIIDLAAHAALEGDLGPGWSDGWSVFCLGVPKGTGSPSTHETKVEPDGRWRVEGLEAELGRTTGAALRTRTLSDPSRIVAYVVELRRWAPGGVMQSVPLATGLVLTQGEVRHLVTDWITTTVPLDAVVLIDGIPARPGTRLVFTLVSGDAAARRDVEPVDELTLRGLDDVVRGRSSALRGEVGQDGRVRLPALPRGTYGVATEQLQKLARGGVVALPSHTSGSFEHGGEANADGLPTELRLRTQP